MEHASFIGIRPSGDLKEVQLEFHHRVHYQTVSESTTALQPFVNQIFGSDAVLKITLKPFVSQPQVANISDAREEEKRLDLEALSKRAHDDPLVRKAVELFGGEILAVVPAKVIS